MNITTKNKPAMHLKAGEHLVLRNETSGKVRTFAVLALNEDESKSSPVQVTVAIPSLVENEKDTTAVIGYTYRENVEVTA